MLCIFIRLINSYIQNGGQMTIKEKHKELKKQVNEAEIRRRIRRGPKSWSDLRRLKKLKLAMKDKLLKSKK
tara:strand:+ start:13945 stop:14157 length:213 start_codon:yes stop_codon:yes gene_type:complete